MARHNKTKTIFDADEENSWETTSAQDIGAGKPGVAGSGTDDFRDFSSGGFGGGREDLFFTEIYSAPRGGNKGKPSGDEPSGDDGGGGGGDPGVLSSYTSGDPDGYNIEIKFKGAWTTDLQSAFIDSAEFLSTTIVSDISDVFYRGNVIDDIKITASLKAIDGEGGILGQAGPTAIRTSNYLPATAIMEFDSADAEAYLQKEQWGAIVTHEMLHSIGFGTVWNYNNLVADDAVSSLPIFTGANATLTYKSLYDDPDATGVPLENGGGSGTALAHWEEDVFTDMLMTGYIDDTTINKLSEVTIASLEDIGYDTTWDAADYYTLIG